MIRFYALAVALALAPFAAPPLAAQTPAARARTAEAHGPDAAGASTTAQRGQATFVVTTTADSGPGSLRQALLNANAAPGPHTIMFRIDGGGAYREIFLLSKLPSLFATVEIDGDTQGCADRAVGPCVRLDGAAAAGTSFIDAGLDVLGAGSTVRNLVLTRFFRGTPAGGDDGSALFLGNSRITVTGCRIGTDRTGRITDPDGVPRTGDELGNGAGIVAVPSAFTAGSPLVVPTGLRIGGPDLADANVVSGNVFEGIVVRANDSVVEGNLVGVGADGSTRLGNGDVGIVVSGNRGNSSPPVSGVRVVGNVASGNGVTGIRIVGAPGRTVVSENLVGTNADGTAAVPNGTPVPTGLPAVGFGISVLDSDGVLVEQNVVSGNTAIGIALGSATPGLDGLRVSNATVVTNFVGIGLDGKTPIPNGTPGNENTGIGIAMLGAGTFVVTGNHIGGRTDVEANVVAGNTRAGIGAFGPTASGNEIVGNAIGFTTGGDPLPNGGAGGIGIGFASGARGNRVGAMTLADDAAANTVGPHAAPIASLPDAGEGNAVGFNQLVRATASPLAVFDLGADGPTPNDAGDADEGPNRLQNTPVLTGARFDGRTLTVTARIDTTPANAAYPLRVHLYEVLARPGGVELYVPVGLFDVTAAQAGQAVTASVPASLDSGSRLAATATDANGNTSELQATALAVAGEAQAGPAEAPRLALAGPNPARGTAALTLRAPQAQSVRVTLVDALGRTVAVLHDGPVPAEALRLTADASAFAPGVYVVRAVGDGWAQSVRLTLAR